MAFSTKVLADSVSPESHRITTFEVTFPRFVLAEFNTHRVFSRNSASSRAIPVVKQLRRVLEDPYVPTEFGSNKPGMQAGDPLAGEAHSAATAEWLRARDDAVRHVLGLIVEPGASIDTDSFAARLEEIEAAVKAKSIPDRWLNVHKQVANRLLEPFMWHTVIVTATEWQNFWNLRTHSDTQPELRRAAIEMRDHYEASEPSEVEIGEWHLPLIRPDDLAQDPELSQEELKKISAGRCARVSYLTHLGERDTSADIELHDRLKESGHMSPLEHPARPMTPAELEERDFTGNFRGWFPYRKEIPNEADALGDERLEVSVAG